MSILRYCDSDVYTVLDPVNDLIIELKRQVEELGGLLAAEKNENSDLRDQINDLEDR